MYHLQDIECRQGDFTLRVEDVHIPAGDICSVTGPNGGGKTMLLNLLAFLDGPEAGHVVFNGCRVAFGNEAQMLVLRRGVSCLLQTPYLFNASVLDNVAYGLKMRGVSAAQVRARVGEVMERLALLPLAGRNAHRLSGGEAQRVAVARTLVLGCDVLVLDEPTSGVDREHLRTVEDMILELNRERGVTVIVSTHSRKQACRLAQRHICVADDGDGSVAGFSSVSVDVNA